MLFGEAESNPFQHISMKRIMMAAGLTLCMATISAARLDYTYNFAGAPSEGYGNSKTETYDVAVRLANPSFVGAKVTGIRVAVPSDGTADASAWLSSELKLRKKNGKNVNDPDIASVAGTVTDGWLDITFDSPYTIPAEGVYVGYSFTVTDLNASTETPVAVAAGANPYGLYLHSSRTKLRWGAMSEELCKVSTMTVVLDGSFPDKSAVFSVGLVRSAVDKSATVTLPLMNCGTSAISSIEYTGVAADRTFGGSCDLAAPISGNIGASGYVSVEVPGMEDCGEYPLKLRVSRVNGDAVDCTDAEGTLKVFPFLPVNRPLVEEYTGLWCGWCPRGYVALETMKERKGDLFIAAAYHNGDAMSFPGNTPNSPGGYPAGYINRSVSINLAEIYTGWDTYRTWIPDGGVDVAVEWADEAHTAVKATATARFIEDHSGAEYRLSYLMVADGLSDPSWKQHNSYSGATDKKDEMPGSLGDLFINGGKYVEGLTFNDVVLAASDFDGERGSIPADIIAGEEYTHVHLFDMEEIAESLGKNAGKLLSKPGKLRVITVLMDGRSGKFINCNSSAHMDGEPMVDPSSVESISEDVIRVETGRWTLDGRRVDAPVHGVNIVRYSDGSVRKELVREK